MTDEPEPDAEPAAPTLTAEDRRRNVERVRKVESLLGRAEDRMATLAYEMARELRGVHELRDELRSIFGMPGLDPVAPAFEKAELPDPPVATKRKRGAA